MFLDRSRYAKIATDELTSGDGRSIAAIRLRRLPATSGEAYAVNDNDQLDIIANERFGDATRFWHIADANTALQANELVAVTGDVVLVPKS